ncbi:O-antigen ligase family protein [Clostridium sporogenes]|uniref:O-antigen ligase family protein n=1 Tax=Clostridium sporogenes TaxID=1509 RepID=UPI003F912406
MNKIKHSIIEKNIYYLLIITPLIDLINGFFYYIVPMNLSVSPGQIIRMTIFVIIFYFYIKQRKGNIILAIILFSFFLIQEYLYSCIDFINFKDDVLFASKLYFNLFLMLLLKQYYYNKDIDENKIINGIIIGAIIIGLTIIVTKFLNIGVSSYGDTGYKGIFIGLNDITAVLVMATPFVLYKLIYSYKKIKYGICFLIILGTAVLLGTKTAIIGIILLTFYYTFFGIRGKNKYKKYIFTLLFMMIIIYVFYVYFFDVYKLTILRRHEYFYSNLDFISYLLSGRNQLLNIGYEYWKNKWYHVILGVGFTRGSTWISSFILGHGMIEMDILDILYFYGFIVLGIYIYSLLPVFLKSILKIIREKSMLKKSFFISFLIGSVVSFLGGHVLLSPLAGVYFCVVFAYSNNYIRPATKGEIHKTNNNI